MIKLLEKHIVITTIVFSFLAGMAFCAFLVANTLGL